MAELTVCKTFINEIAPLIQAEAKKRGYTVVSTVIAQACTESAYNTSILGWKYHNYFGMKCGSKWLGKSVNLKTKEEYSVGQLTDVKANFRAYDSMVEGVAGYYAFISTTRYANLKTALNYKEYAEMLKKDGYATSSTYVNTLCACVEKWNLQKYDSIFESTSNFYPKYTGNSNSIVNALQELKIDSNYNFRKKIAQANGISLYTGTAEQNTRLLKALKNGELIKP